MRRAPKCSPSTGLERALRRELRIEKSATTISCGDLCTLGSARRIATALIAIGVVGYVATDRQSATALIPAFLGLLLLAFGWLSRNEAYRKHAMHAVVVFALLGLLGTIGGLIRLLGGTTTPAAISQGLTAILTGALLALCVKSFIDARRRRAQG